MTVQQLLLNVSSAELTEWMAFLQIQHEQDEPDETEVWKKAFNVNG